MKNNNLSRERDQKSFLTSYTKKWNNIHIKNDNVRVLDLPYRLDQRARKKKSASWKLPTNKHSEIGRS